MNIICFDSGPGKVDRFTFIHILSGCIFRTSEHPFNPLGFGQFCGEVSDFGLTVDEYIHNARIDKHLGNEINATSLPKDAQDFIKQRIGLFNVA